MHNYTGKTNKHKHANQTTNATHANQAITQAKTNKQNKHNKQNRRANMQANDTEQTQLPTLTKPTSTRKQPNTNNNKRNM